MTFAQVLSKYRKISFSQRDKGERFERLMQTYLLTDPKYAYLFKKVWLWNEFPGRNDFGGTDTGIDLVALTTDGVYWAIQCKCFQEASIIDKPAVDSFLSTSSRKFSDGSKGLVGFTQRLWISTTNKWGPNATEALKNQHPPVARLNLFDLQEAPVDWDKLENGIHGELSRTPKKTLRAHQKEALDKAHAYFKTADRGKLIMACGTGKTFNALRIAENETNGHGLILFLMPSISLLGQTLREWSSDANEPINAICICSDPDVSSKKSRNEDTDTFSKVDLALPASTDVREIVNQFKRLKSRSTKGLTVVFSTYQSIEVISKAQKELSLAKIGYDQFDLIICDEAHRTTGVTVAGEDESAFTKVHDNKFIKGKKRIYMTATPRLYSDDIKSKAAQMEAILCSMDDVALYGEEIYRIGFGEAVERDLLSDYKVLILTLSEKDVPPAIQKMISDKESEINTDDASKLIGCINALSKQILGDEGIIKNSDPEPMRRAVAFCQTIAVSKKITATYNTATEAYISSLPEGNQEQMVSIASKHIDGTMSAPVRDELLGWLKEPNESNECRVLTNVRCLSEGVDVPALDAVMFLSARNSQVDVVQSVGRVMRKSPETNKKYGYIIIPVVVPSNVEADKALDDNERYKVVWTVLNALRAHDDRFNATVNKIDLNRRRPEQILVGRPEYSWEDGRPVAADPNMPYGTSKDISQQLALQFEQLQHVVFARMVQKVGDKRYWEQWAKSVAEIAQRHEQRINQLIKENDKYKMAFDKFLNGLQRNINPNIEAKDAIEMLSQHLITAPVFEALFEGYSFVKNNPISTAMQGMLNLLEEQALEKDRKSLEKFYDSVRKRAEGIDNSEGKQRIILELYEKYFKTALPKLVDRLGIVYTPVEVVDFVIHSVNDVLQKEFNRSIGDENIHILDPFTGTGTFVTRLIQSGLIDKEHIAHKYKYELHANEIVLLAYYIAAVNIENAYHDLVGESEYTAFEGICLTDTFQLGETDNSEKLFSEMFPQNSARVAKQKKAPLRVIIGNPPYSVGQKSVNDNAQNQKYEKLDKRIATTYVALTSATNKNSLYDSYMKAFRWSTDRLDENGGIICFVSNGAWIDGNSADGFRKSIEKEFTSIYVFNLRGNQRTSGELSRKEGGKIFGSGSRTPIAITLLVKNPSASVQKAKIQYRDIGDYFSREEKLSIISRFATVINKSLEWETLVPNVHGDWISKRNEVFGTFIGLGDRDKDSNAVFNLYSGGLQTNRDPWIYNYSRTLLSFNVRRMIEYYNSQLFDLQRYCEKHSTSPEETIDKVITNDHSKISWTRGLRNDLVRYKEGNLKNGHLRTGAYRPFCKQNVYVSNQFNEYVNKMESFFPDDTESNLVICVSSRGSTSEFASLMVNQIPNVEFVSRCQCLPLFYFEKRNKISNELFDDGGKGKYIRRDGISDYILKEARARYSKELTKEDIFYYVYGYLHSAEYRETFANDLKKMLPRINLVTDEKDFWKFSKAGRSLSGLHTNYESAQTPKEIKVVLPEIKHQMDAYEFYRVEKIRFPKKGQKDSIIYNSRISVEKIPARAYEYVVSGKSAIEWIMERYQVSIDLNSKGEGSGIKNDPNDWSIGVEKPSYILDLLLSVISVSVQTVEIVEGLPKLKFD
jgi:predicted helicase